MARARGGSFPPQVRFYTLLTLGLIPAVLGAILVVYRIMDRTPPWVYWKIGLAFLVVLDVVYAVAVLAAAVGLLAVLTGWRLLEHSKARRRAAARVLLLCGTIVVCVVLSESAASLALLIDDHSSAVPVGGLGQRGDDVPSIPSSLETVALPTAFPDDPDDGTIVVSIVGESSAAGVPYERWLSVASIVARRLGEEIPGKKFVHHVVAMSGSTLEEQHRELAKQRRRPDVLIVYCGHNEFSARIERTRDLDYYEDARAPGWFARTMDWSKLHRLVMRNAAKCRIAIPPSRGERRPAIDSPAFTQAEYTRLLDDFERRLEAMATYAERLGAILVLIAPPANDSGFEPNRSYLPPSTTWAERRAFQRALDDAQRLEASDPDAAVARYRSLVDQQPGFAAAHYRLARLLESKGAWAEVYEHDVKARDADGYPMRCFSSFQDVYREVAARHDAVYIDGQEYFHRVGTHGLLDDGLFHDGMHPSLRGQIALAQAVLRGLHERRAFGWPSDAPVPTIDPEECARYFRLDRNVWRYLCLWGIMFYDITTPATHDPSRRSRKRQAFIDAADKLEAGVEAEDVGLRNIGVCEPVPIVPYGTLSTQDSSLARNDSEPSSDGDHDGSGEAVLGASRRQQERDGDVQDQ